MNAITANTFLHDEEWVRRADNEAVPLIVAVLESLEGFKRFRPTDPAVEQVLLLRDPVRVDSQFLPLREVNDPLPSDPWELFRAINGYQYVMLYERLMKRFDSFSVAAHVIERPIQLTVSIVQAGGSIIGHSYKAAIAECDFVGGVRWDTEMESRNLHSAIALALLRYNDWYRQYTGQGQYLAHNWIVKETE